MVFNYWTDSFEGELMNPPEGELLWVPMDTALHLPMQNWFKERFPYIFEKVRLKFNVFGTSDLDKQVVMILTHTKSLESLQAFLTSSIFLIS